jgi:SAM-dependent methyltransferase
MIRASHRIFTITFIAAVAVTSSSLTGQAIVEPKPGQPGKDVVWVPTPADVVEKMLDLARVTPQDFVIDLGSGDGRNVIAAAKRGARALGVEYNPDLVELSRRRARDAGVVDKATFVRGDMYKADISRATVLALFLTPEVLDQMRDKFLALKPGTRIVLNTFPVTDWEPDVTEVTPAPCKIWCTTMLMIVPAQVEGTWQIGTAQMTLRQDFQFVRGKIGNQEVTGRLRGDEISLRAGDTEYTGRVTADRIEGVAKIAGLSSQWTASRLRLAR